jgi:hypothetical protein
VKDHGSDALVRDLSARVAAYAPGWTEPSDSDPGVTIVGLIAFLAEELARGGTLSSPAQARLRHTLDRLETLDTTGCRDATLVRVRYFFGQALSVDEFEIEQAYQRAKHRRHNRLLHGIGIVHGLAVGIEHDDPAATPMVIVSPGVAISPDGEELVVCERSSVPVCQGPATCYVAVRFVERSTGVTVTGEASRTEELAEVAALESVQPGDLVIGRLTLDRGTWQTDPSFVPARVAT